MSRTEKLKVDIELSIVDIKYYLITNYKRILTMSIKQKVIIGLVGIMGLTLVACGKTPDTLEVSTTEVDIEYVEATPTATHTVEPTATPEPEEIINEVLEFTREEFEMVLCQDLAQNKMRSSAS